LHDIRMNVGDNESFNSSTHSRMHCGSESFKNYEIENAPGPLDPRMKILGVNSIVPQQVDVLRGAFTPF